MPRLTFVLLLFHLLVVGCGPHDTEKPKQPEPTPNEPPPGASLLDVEAIDKLLGNQESSAKAIQAGPYEYAWQNFIALNQPLVGPDAKRWELWRQTSTVYLPDGAKPAPWGTPAKVPDEVLANVKSLPDAPSATVWHNLDTRIQVDGLVLLDKWNHDVRYQLLMNKDTFDYVLMREFYNVNGQQRAAEENKPADFPWTSYELKTSWIWIGYDVEKFNALKGKYYIVSAYYQVFNDDGMPVGYDGGYAALSGMHIINKTLPNWVWMTFENVNNAEFTQVKLELEIPAGAQAANQRYQAALRSAGSIFANYQLDGVQTVFTDPGGKPTLLANSNIESAFQKKSSCITCHAIASINKVGKYFNIVDSSGGDLTYYVGDPPDVEAKGFTTLDFVWSMKRASRQFTESPE